LKQYILGLSAGIDILGSESVNAKDNDALIFNAAPSSIISFKNMDR